MGSIVVTDDTTRVDLAITIALVNADAKRCSRRGYVGTQSPEYAEWHRLLDQLVTDYLAAKA